MGYQHYVKCKAKRLPVRHPSRLHPSGPVWCHNPWKCPTVPSLPPLSSSSFLLHILLFSTVVLLLASPGRGVWTMQRDLAARGGLLWGVREPQMRPEVNIPPSILPASPPLGVTFPSTLPPDAQQANQAKSVFHAALGPRGWRKGGG